MVKQLIFKKPRQDRGFALVLVLIAVTMAATMVAFFLVSAGRERRGVDSYARGSEVRHLAEMSVHRVLGLINAATKEGTAASPVSWASQPGMVRTFGSDGNLRNAYKLYSWDTVVEPGSTYNPYAGTQVPPADWQTRRATFTDLNQPAAGVYPIVDPSVATTPSADPGVIGTVDGFTVDATNPAIAGTGLKAPMPVKWLYVLEDGQMVAPSSDTAATAKVDGASDTNRIVGRVAFWTDDETSKVNINTASEGNYWDWPKAATRDELQMAGNVPVTGEYNRTPGHPAMTSLSAVFPELDPGDRWAGDVNTFQSKLKALLAVAPRVNYGDLSSRGGTYPIPSHDFYYGPTSSDTIPTIPSVPLSKKTERLFVSPDEVIFTYPGRKVQPSITTDMAQRRAFFLTSQSRAPETTLFETPRVSLWPITWPYASAHASLANRQTAAVSSPTVDSSALKDNTWMRPEERLLAFVSTLNQARSDGGDKYYFQRQNSESPTWDYANIARNKTMISYLQTLTNKDVPGYGGNLATKLTAPVRDAVLANAFNVVRSMVNQYTLEDSGRMFYSYTPISFSKFHRPNDSIATNYSESGAFSPIPLKIDVGSGSIATVSEFPLLREAALVFYATQRVDPIAPANPADVSDPNKWQNLINLGNAPVGYISGVGARTNLMQAVMLLDFSPLRGSTRNNQPVFWVKVSNASGMNAAGTSLGLANAVAKMDFRAVGTGRRLIGYLLPLFKKDANGNPTNIKTFNNGDVTNDNYGLVSSPISVDPNATTFNFVGDNLTINVYGIKDGNPDTDPTSDANLLMGSYTVKFTLWNGSYGVPLAPRWNLYEIANETPQYFPNPNYQLHDATRPSKWAGLEIGAGYRTADSSGDPVNGGTTSVWTLNSMFSTDTATGMIKVPPPPPAAQTLFGKTVTYAYRDTSSITGLSEPCMTDYAKRLRFIPLITGVSDNPLADHGTGRVLCYSQMDTAAAGYPAITAYDTVLSMVVDPNGPGNGDPRLAQKFEFARADTVLASAAMLRQVVADSSYPRLNKQYHALGGANQSSSATGYVTTSTYALLGKTIAPAGMALTGASSNAGKLGNYGTSRSDGDAVQVTSAKPQALVSPTGTVGDWSSQAGYEPDGGSIPRPDQDFQALSNYGVVGGSLSYQVPYFRVTDSQTDGLASDAAKGYFSPNRQIASPITLLGSLPSSLTTGWQTLAFSPNPSVGSGHPGLAKPKDYLLLDLFWMPVAEPYPISEEFSTAGKVNLNYKIVPFTYVQRRTALHALLKSTWITALNNSIAANYKGFDYVKDEANSKTRYTINIKETLDRADMDVFNSGDIFRSAAQVCDLWLVPQSSTASTVQSFWTDKLLTSDTAREEPYNNLYSRVTTKSNTFTVHWRVQALRKSPNGEASTWSEVRDRMVGELRGSTLVERYIDPNATTIPDYATAADAKPLTNFYKWRVVSENFFQP